MKTVYDEFSPMMYRWYSRMVPLDSVVIAWALCEWALFAFKPKPFAVTDDMARAACRIWYGNDNISDGHQSKMVAAMKAAMGARA
jgi:hypothetical protein